MIDKWPADGAHLTAQFISRLNKAGPGLNQLAVRISNPVWDIEEMVSLLEPSN